MHAASCPQNVGGQHKVVTRIATYMMQRFQSNEQSSQDKNSIAVMSNKILYFVYSAITAANLSEQAMHCRKDPFMASLLGGLPLVGNYKWLQLKLYLDIEFPKSGV